MFKLMQLALLFGVISCNINYVLCKSSSLSSSSSSSSWSPLVTLPTAADHIDLRETRSADNDPTIGQKDICTLDGCRCENATISCEFNKETKLKNNIRIGKNATALRLNVASSLTIFEGLFSKVRINSVQIIGSPRSKFSRVEFSTKAFFDTLSPLLELIIVDVRQVVIREGVFSTEILLNITNAEKVIVWKNCFARKWTSFKGTFRDIKLLDLNDRAFADTNISTIDIIETNIDDLECIANGNIKGIAFVNSTIKRIVKGAFITPEIKSIKFVNTQIGTIVSEAFKYGVLCDSLEFSHCTVDTIESSAINETGTTRFTFNYNNVTNFNADAFNIFGQNVSIECNQITNTGPKWLSIKSESELNVRIVNNSFGIYNLAEIHGGDKSLCEFRQNAITEPQANSLEMHRCTIGEIFFKRPCDCGFRWLKKLRTNAKQELQDTSYCSVDNQCVNVTVIKMNDYEKDFCRTSGHNKCEHYTNRAFDKPAFIDSGQENSNKLIVIGVLSSVVLIVICCIVTLLICRPCTAGGQTHSGTNRTLPQKPKTSGALKHSKSFTTDDRLIINQTLEIMKHKQAPERYDQVFNNTKKMLDGDLSESEKVLTIGEIVHTLGECENSGDDFVAFTGILFKHLEPKDTNQNDPIYAEPNEITTNRTVHHDDRNQTNVDPIYAEPNSVQQPLLTNEYAAPLDRNEMNALYTEPIARGKPHATGAYAICGRPQEALPSTSKNLPDVLNADRRPTNVQRLANALSKQMQMTGQRPSGGAGGGGSHKLPVYTIPTPKKRTTTLDRDHGERSELHNLPSLAAMPSSSSCATAPPSNSGSEHSGGSDITVQMDDVIDYADA